MKLFRVRKLSSSDLVEDFTENGNSKILPGMQVEEKFLYENISTVGGPLFKHNSGKLTLLKGIGERAKRERHYIQHVCRFCPLTCSDSFF